MKYKATIVFEHEVDTDKAKEELKQALVDENYEEVEIEEFEQVE